MKAPLILLAVSVCASAFGQVGTTTTTVADGNDLTPTLTAAALWNGSALPGRWRDVSKESDKTSKELLTLGPVFGVRPQQVQAYFNGGGTRRAGGSLVEDGEIFWVLEKK